MHRVLIGVVVAGAVVIAGIGFAGSYAAVRELAIKKGFGNFSYVFPIGIDAGICVLLALDLLLTWIRIPFPLLRQTAWLLTIATIAFNGAAAWPDPLGVGMHAVIPILFVVSVEAARHAIGRIADITADKHMEGVRLTRWLLSPVPTFLLWRRMKLWELRSYEQVIKLEQDRLVYQARLHSRFGRAWRRKAPVESLMPLRLARYGVPLAQTAPSGLAAAGIEPVLLPPPPAQAAEAAQLPTAVEGPVTEIDGGGERLALPKPIAAAPAAAAGAQPVHTRQSPGQQIDANGVFAEAYQSWLAHFQVEPTARQFAAFLQERYAITTGAGHPLSDEQLHPILVTLQERYAAQDESSVAQDQAGEPEESDDVEWGEFFYRAWQDYVGEHGQYADAEQLASFVFQRDGITAAGSRPLAGMDIEGFVEDFWQREFGESAPGPADAAEAAAPSIPPQAGPRDEPIEGTASAAARTRRQEIRVPSEPGTADGDESPNPSADDEQGEGEPAAVPGERGGLTTVDRYYLAWADYVKQYGQEPRDRQLSAFLAEQHGVLGRGGQGVSPSTLRRYLPGFRVYAAWAALREHTTAPTAQDVARECATREISVRKSPVTAEAVESELADFERRWQALAWQERRNSSVI
ncbi:DUF2637 domain-containing protein [Streptomyces sp. NBC_00687]|uniref:DUF2637 domain-containing protein n=1 Tax=Streptomyces sp. NBC_00687 TaxID=2975807 RepID=UPI0022541DBD|nr:DUF2637 domain-containing protein [Streptomyces sp. NBC_00687]MCX4919910.1 DUF2637 domain-containing protein [Streptomyces sp. NBC_00687]